MIPIDEAAYQHDSKRSIMVDNFQPIRSPIDGTTIKTKRQYEDHCKKHNVVPSAEFSPEFLARKRAERERLFKGEFTEKESLERKQEIYEAIVRAERNGR